MKIGDIELGDKPLYLAPMEDVTDPSFRYMCKLFGADVVITEFISSDGLIRDAWKSRAKLNIDEGERPVGIQIYGHLIEPMVEAARIAETAKPDFIDINFGCPMPKVYNNGDGSAVMKDPALCEAIVKAVVKAVEVPVTAKIRKGIDENNLCGVEVAKACEAGGASAVFVHGRTREQLYSGVADRNYIKQVKEVLSIPVIGNGDIDSVESALDMLHSTGCDGIMVGRGCYGRPWLFRELICHFEGLPYTPPDNAEIRGVIRRQIRLLEADRGTKALLEMRKHLSKYCRGSVGSAKLREKINSVSTREEIEELIEILFP